MDILPLNKKIGIIGGGQLGKMMILEAKKLGSYITVLDPTKNCPASSICDEHIVANFDDKNALLNLAKKSDIITYEFEHIDYAYLLELEKDGHKIYPSPKCLEIIQNKFTQKTMLKKHNIPVAEFLPVHSIDDIEKIGEMFSYPIVLKSCTGGYDGKGNYIIKSVNDISKAYKTLNKNGNTSLMVEKFVPFKMEISVLACGGIDKQVKIYPVGNNIHINNILHKTMVPANISDKTKDIAIDIANKIINIFNGVGIFRVEFFVAEDGQVLVNEIAPRPHNSGHYTIEGCKTNQFENHIRAILNLPLGDTSLINPSVMINLLGEEGYNGNCTVLGIIDALKLYNVKLHIYGKEKTAPKRKMGHLTCTANSLEDANKTAEEAFNHIKFISK